MTFWWVTFCGARGVEGAAPYRHAPTPFFHMVCIVLWKFFRFCIRISNPKIDTLGATARDRPYEI